MLGQPLIAPTTFGGRQYEGEFSLPKMKTTNVYPVQLK